MKLNDIAEKLNLDTSQQNPYGQWVRELETLPERGYKNLGDPTHGPFESNFYKLWRIIKG